MNTKHINSREIFETWPIPKALTELALPMIFGQLIILVYNLADTFFIGRTNNPLMVAGVSLLLVDKTNTAKSLSEHNSLFLIRIYPELVRSVHLLCPCLCMYFFITSIGAPPVVSKQKLLDQNISFQSFLRIAGNFFFMRRDEALL